MMEDPMEQYHRLRDEAEAHDRHREHVDTCDDMDKAWGDDMPTTLSMAEVLEVEIERLNEARNRALDMQCNTALRAIVEGSDMREVAVACGFKLEPQKPQYPPGSMMAVFGQMANVYYEDDDSYAPPGSDRDLQPFVQWLSGYLVRRAQGKALA